MAMHKKKLPPVHPAKPCSDHERSRLSANALPRLRVPGNRITAILNGQRGITADTALRWAATSAPPLNVDGTPVHLRTGKPW